MEEKRRRKGHDDDYNGFETTAAKDAVAKLHKMIAEEATNDVLRCQVRFIKKLLKNAPPQETNWTLDHGETRLFELIKRNKNKDDIRLQSDIVQHLNGAPPPSKSTLQNHHR